MESAILLIKNNYDRLTKSEQIIADFVLSYPHKVLEYSIDELSLATYSSNSTISRFAKKLGISDYKNFRVLLAKDVGFISQLSTKINNQENLLYTNIDESIEALRLLKDMISEDEIIICTHLINNANRVDFFGRGVSNLVAQDMHQKFIKVKSVTNSYVDASMQNTGAATLKKNDVAIFFSYSGEKEVIKTMQIAKTCQAKIILVTKYNSDSVAQQYADCILFLPTVDSSDQKLHYTTSRILMMALVDLLYLNYINNYKDSIDHLFRVETFAHL